MFAHAIKAKGKLKDIDNETHVDTTQWYGPSSNKEQSEKYLAAVSS